MPASSESPSPRSTRWVGRHAQVAAEIDRLVRTLWTELNRAQLDTSPAIRIRALAARPREQATDLQRRQRLVHEMERQRIGFGSCSKNGIFWRLPDEIAALQAQIDGGEAAALAESAASGDRAALGRLARFAFDAGDPDFSRALLQRLGAERLITLPAALAQRIRIEWTATTRRWERTRRPSRTP